MATPPDPQLLAAYTGADYEIQTPRPFTLHVGQLSASLLALHRLFRVASSAVVTACNPGGEQRDTPANALAHQRLIEAVVERGWHYVPAMNRDPRGEWPDEPGVLVLGADQGAAVALGGLFDQAAVLFNGADGLPQLLWRHRVR